MEYRVFSRKYRPQCFEEVIGQEVITKTLKNAIKRNRLAQAYLFVGSRGIGKTSTARILAKSLNCPYKSQNCDPCGICDSCVEIAEGRNLDVLEIDGASNNSVDSIRHLKESCLYAPAHGAFKIYLIDEVHMLSTAAFNALLKILEEPPHHIRFLFATTEPHKLPSTILSRCQRFDLKKIPPKKMISHLLMIAEKENIILDIEAAKRIAYFADGSLRDGESTLDQLVSFSGENISLNDVEEILGLTSRTILFQLLKETISLNRKACLKIIQIQNENGKDFGRFLLDFIAFIQEVLILKNCSDMEEVEQTELSNQISDENLLRLIDSLHDGESRMRWATDKKMQFEMLILKAIYLLEEKTLSDVLNFLAEFSDPVTIDSQVNSVLNSSKTNNSSEIKATDTMNTVVETSNTTNIAKDASVLWQECVKKLITASPVRFGFLVDSVFIELKNNNLVVDFPDFLNKDGETENFDIFSQLKQAVEQFFLSKIGDKVNLIAKFSIVHYHDNVILEATKDVDSLNNQESIVSSKNLPISKKVASLTKTIDIKKDSMEHSDVSGDKNFLEKFKNDPLIVRALKVFEAEIQL